MFDLHVRTRLGTPHAGRSRWAVLMHYLVASGVAWFSTALTFRVPALASTRLALSYLAVVLAAILFDYGPALAALFVSIIAFNVYGARHGAPFPHAHSPLISLLVTATAGCLTVLLIYRSRVSETHLNTLVAQMKEQAEALTQAQQASRSAAWTYDPATEQTHWYEGGAPVFGLPAAEMTALGSPLAMVAEEDLAAVDEAIDHTARTGEPLAVQFRVRWPNGELRWLEARGTPLPGNPKLWCGATMDITERKLAEQALIHSEKLAIAGRLAASIAHEINNPLEAVTNLCYLARLTTTEPEAKRYIAMAEEELARVAQITSQTLRFHRQQSAAAETDLVEVVRSLLALFEHKLSAASIVAQYAALPVAPLRCYAGEIRQVVANLIGNAIDAMPGGGTLRVRVRAATMGQDLAPALRITVADTGDGIRPETIKRIYEPFFTTKAEVGTGLGLWVCSTLVEKHHGRLSVRSSVNPGRSGTVFVVTLPYGGVARGPVRTPAGRALQDSSRLQTVQA